MLTKHKYSQGDSSTKKATQFVGFHEELPLMLFLRKSHYLITLKKKHTPSFPRCRK